MVKKIAHITDLHLDEKFPNDFGVNAKENWRKLLNNVKEQQITEIVFTGDIGTYESNEWFFSSIRDYKLDLKITLGNHDLFSEVINYYNIPLPKDQRELYYSYEDEYYKYLYLDSSLAELSYTQFNWFRGELTSNKKVIVFIHHPILETGTTPQREYPLKESEKIKKELLGVESEVFVFCGHLHFQDIKEEKNIVQMVTPAASYQAKKYSRTTEGDNISFGYRIIEVHKSEIKTEVITFHPTKL